MPRSEYGGKRVAIIDGDERVLTYDELVRARWRSVMRSRRARGRAKRSA